MRFLPLAMSEMGGEGVCVAGIDVASLQWIRPVVRNYSCLFAEQAQAFQSNAIHQMEVGSRQVRPKSKDPFKRHAEDRVLLAGAAVASFLDPTYKRTLLVRLAESNLLDAVLAPSRSLFLVRPNHYGAALGEDEWRWNFTVGSTSIAALCDLPALDELATGVSRRGMKCTCPRWTSFAADKFSGSRQIHDRDITGLPGSPVLYLTLSLSSVKYEKYWMMVAGVHLVGESQIWL